MISSSSSSSSSSRPPPAPPPRSNRRTTSRTRRMIKMMFIVLRAASRAITVMIVLFLLVASLLLSLVQYNVQTKSTAKLIYYHHPSSSSSSTSSTDGASLSSSRSRSAAADAQGRSTKEQQQPLDLKKSQYYKYDITPIVDHKEYSKNRTVLTRTRPMSNTTIAINSSTLVEGQQPGQQVEEQEQLISPWSYPYHMERNKNNQEIQQKILHHLQTIPECHQKQKLLEILYAAGYTEINAKICSHLPTWDIIQQMYGSYPIVYGMNTCSIYQQRLHDASKQLGYRVHGRIGIGGMYNTGTNALQQSITRNLILQEDYVDIREKTQFYKDTPYDYYRLPWDKHTPNYYKWNYTLPYHNDTNKSFILPILLIRDPYHWMITMCKNSYKAHWYKTTNCPNLLQPTKKGVPPFRNTSSTTYQVHVKYTSHLSETYTSLAHLWTQWYESYLNNVIHPNKDNNNNDIEPRLIIRFEDQLFHAEQVMTLISQCSTIPLKSNQYNYRLQRAKQHGNPANFVNAIMKYGPLATIIKHYHQVFNGDILYAQDIFNESKLMNIFHYPHISTHPDNDIAIQTSYHKDPVSTSSFLSWDHPSHDHDEMELLTKGKDPRRNPRLQLPDPHHLLQRET